MLLNYIDCFTFLMPRRALHESLVVRVDAHAGRIVGVRNLVRH